MTYNDLAIRCCCLRRHNQPILNVSILLQTLFINKFHGKSVLKLFVKCAKLLHILKKVHFIAFRRVTCFGISPFLLRLSCTFSSWRLRVYKQYNVVSIEFVCWNKDLFVCTCTCCDKNGGKVADYFKIMAQLKLTLT